jgi:hypothetical protein
MSVGSGRSNRRKTFRLPHHEKNENAFSIGLRNNSGIFSLRGVLAGRMRQFKNVESQSVGVRSMLRMEIVAVLLKDGVLEKMRGLIAPR